MTELFGPVTEAQRAALASRGTRANPAYIPVDVDLMEQLVRSASAALRECPEVENKHRFVAEHILGRHIDKEDPCSA